MSAISTHPARKTRRPLEAVNVIACFLDASLDDLATGDAVLLLQRVDNNSPEEAYHVAGLFDGGHLYGIRLEKFFSHGNEDGMFHTVQLDGLSCDCQDAVYRSGRPGGCKHAAGLRLALPRLLKTRC